MSKCPICGGLGYMMGLPCIGCKGDGKSRFITYYINKMTYLNEEQEKWKREFVKNGK
jgi:DnaJ-class molecular chaperone